MMTFEWGRTHWHLHGGEPLLFCCLSAGASWVGLAATWFVGSKEARTVDGAMLSCHALAINVGQFFQRAPTTSLTVLQIGQGIDHGSLP